MGGSFAACRCMDICITASGSIIYASYGWKAVESGLFCTWQKFWPEVFECHKYLVKRILRFAFFKRHYNFFTLGWVQSLYIELQSRESGRKSLALNYGMLHHSDFTYIVNTSHITTYIAYNKMNQLRIKLLSQTFFCPCRQSWAPSVFYNFFTK